MAEISAAARFMAEREPRSRDAADECRRNEPYVLSRWAGRTTCLPALISGGERAAAIYTLIGTAKLNKVDPEAYLRQVLTQIDDHPIKRIEELLPWTVAAVLEAAS
jgi:hypothetical protein